MRARLAVTILLAACRLAAGQDAEPKLAFEVASVKPAGPFLPGARGGMRGGPGTDDPGRVTFPRSALTDLLMQAYDVWADQISGPDWLSNRGSDVYTITATMPPATTKEQFRLMLRNLLAERFRLTLHHETQIRSGYELVVANGGPKLKEWTPPANGAPHQPGSVDANGFPKLDPSAGRGMVVRIPMSGRPAPIRMTLRESMATFCRGLGAQINASNGVPMGGPQPRVVDRTGLDGVYEFTLEFEGAMLPAGMMPPAPTGGDPSPPVASDLGDGAPNLFTALEKQLGLKLQRVKNASVDVLIIDKVDKVPTEN
jgi:uncharacterized protein (TIGR03435 family)